MAVMPNVELHEAIEGGRAAFVPMSDPRVQEIDEAHPRHRRFLRSFTNAFGVERLPTVLLVKPDASHRYRTADAVASFRDVLSMSIVPRSGARTIQYGGSRGVNFSKAFDFYPWVIDKNYKYLIAVTPAMVALHDVKKFGGQVAPEISDMKMLATDLDQPLFDELVKRWRRSYGSRKPAWEDVALMRSLNMAHQASQLPAPVDATLLDYGRLVALWVSAFEILVHPGPNGVGRANKRKVFKLLEETPWEMKENRTRNLKCWEIKKRKRTFVRRPLPSWLYHQLNNARNDFLHGNPIKKRALLLPGTKLSLVDFAGPLYRMALTSFLDLRWKGKLPPVDDAKAFARACGERLNFDVYQRAIEIAIAMSRGYEPKHAAARRARAAGRPRRPHGVEADTAGG
ncbi:MAG: hypothetical protein IID41_07830 [Planctomycetes bacterium]|nr:hypothetical protein [Planctomycetota bacterium]